MRGVMQVVGVFTHALLATASAPLQILDAMDTPKGKLGSLAPRCAESAHVNVDGLCAGRLKNFADRRRTPKERGGRVLNANRDL